MAESKIHKVLKNKIAEGLQELGYTTKIEALVTGGRLDVLGIKDGKEIKVEVINTHCPDWILVEVFGSKRKSIRKRHLIERRAITAPCCGNQQATSKKKGELIFCTRCHNPFVE